MSADLNSSGRDPYSATVRKRFFESSYCGDLSSSGGRLAAGEAGTIAGGAAVRLVASISNGRVVEMRYRAFGCPHLVAALDIICARSEGRDVADLAEFSAAQVLEILDAPIAKLGRLLLVEDAIQSLLDSLGE